MFAPAGKTKSIPPLSDQPARLTAAPLLLYSSSHSSGLSVTGEFAVLGFGGKLYITSLMMIPVERLNVLTEPKLSWVGTRNLPKLSRARVVVSTATASISVTPPAP